MKPSPERTSYFAGLVDGEGYIALFNSTVKDHPNYIKLCVKIQMVDDFQLLKQAQGIWGGWIYNRSAKSEKHRATVAWVMENGTAEKFLKDIYPYTRVKTDQIKIALDFRKFKSKNNFVHPDVLAYRIHLKNMITALHKSIVIEDDKKLRAKALIALKKHRYITPELREKLSLAHKGKSYPSLFLKGHTPWTKGRKLSEEHKRKIGKANKIALKKYYSS